MKRLSARRVLVGCCIIMAFGFGEDDQIPLTAEVAHSIAVCGGALLDPQTDIPVDFGAGH